MQKKFFCMLILSLMMISCQGKQQGEKLMQHTETYVEEMIYEDISDLEIEALGLAINDEYKARATYIKIIEKFGDIKPFSNIADAESKHIDELKRLYVKYNLTVPVDDWAEKVPVFSSVKEACEAGVQAEVENAALYDKLFEMVDNDDITAVFTSLRDASKNNHLPAFQNCAGR